MTACQGRCGLKAGPWVPIHTKPSTLEILLDPVKVIWLDTGQSMDSEYLLLAGDASPL